MANREHKDITDPNIHEVKGASTATGGFVLKANGDATTSFVNPTSLNNVNFANVITASRGSNILPSSTDTGLICPFDSTVSNTDITINSAGTITLNTSGVYFLTFNLNFGRTGVTGVAILAARLLLNDVQFGFTQHAAIDTSANITPGQFNIHRAFNAGDVLKVELIRDSAGNNDGGLIARNITLGTWADGPAYWVRAVKLVGAS